MFAYVLCLNLILSNVCFNIKVLLCTGKHIGYFDATLFLLRSYLHLVPAHVCARPGEDVPSLFYHSLP